jgi:hypothetical protein
MSHVLPEIPPYGEPASPEMRKNKKEKERRRVKGEIEEKIEHGTESNGLQCSESQ